MSYQAQIINIPCDEEASLAANIGAGYTAYREGHKQARHAAAEIAAQADARIAQLEKDRRCMGEIEDIDVANRDNMKARIAELEDKLDVQTKRAACAEQEWARVEKYATEVRAAYQEASEKLLALEAQIGPLRRIAYYANKLDGGASSDEQWREILHAQREAMEPFTDDSFSELKKAVQPRERRAKQRGKG